MTRGMVEPSLMTSRATEPPGPSSSAGPLARLRAGEIEVDEYVEAKLDEATSHLAALAPAELQKVRAALRAELEQDPELRALLRAATSADPRH
jgi:hypothetical protein